jgi:hypothetical protein
VLAGVRAGRAGVRKGRVRCRSACGADELREHSVGEDRFLLSTARLKQRNFFPSSQEPAHERRFADARRPLDKYQPRRAAAHIVKLSMQEIKLIGTPDKQPVSAEWSTVRHRRHTNHPQRKLECATRQQADNSPSGQAALMYIRSKQFWALSLEPGH